jgi:fructose-bisphosphate aldolase, class II
MNHRTLDLAVAHLALSPQDERRQRAVDLRAACLEQGVDVTSIGPWYRAIASGAVGPITVPALNLRGLTYDVARAALCTAMRLECGPIMFELAPPEADAGDLPFSEYVAMVLAAALREGYRGPLFCQADHLHVEGEDAQDSVKALVCEALDAGMLQLDIDAADLSTPAGEANRHRVNAEISAAITAFIRQQAPAADVVVGAEVGVIGGANTTPADIHDFMAIYSAALPSGMAGVGKISVQTGTTHGGVVNADGSVGRMPLDLSAVSLLARTLRENYGLPGVVQHGASTLAADQFRQLPDAGAIEVHLATAIQNTIFEHPAFPAGLRARMVAELDSEVAHAEDGHHSSSVELTPQQRFVQNRWLAWGRYKAELWSIPQPIRDTLSLACEEWFTHLFTALKVANRRGELESIYGRIP